MDINWTGSSVFPDLHLRAVRLGMGLEMLREKFGGENALQWTFRDGGFDIKMFIHVATGDFMFQYRDRHHRGREYAEMRMEKFLDDHFSTIAVMKESIK